MEERARLLEEFKGLQASLEEALELKKSADADAEVDDLLKEIRMQLCSTVAALNALEDIKPTPGVEKSVASDGNTVVCYTSPAPYEVLYDNSTWYSCVITDVIAPVSSLERVRYHAWILGYNVEEEVHSEQLRPWQPQPQMAGAEALRSGATCHAIDTRRGVFLAARVERLTLDNTVILAFNAAEAETVEVPLSHVRVGRFFQQLRKRPELTPEERAKRRAENAGRKRARQDAKRQLDADVASQNANDWQRLVNDLGVSGGGVDVPKKRRL